MLDYLNRSLISYCNNTFSNNDVFAPKRIKLDELENFVIEKCGKRPPSHNDQHMRTVKNNADIITTLCYLLFAFAYSYVIVSLYRFSPIHNALMHLLITFINILVFILIDDFIDLHNLTFMVKIVAWLHDVADHKYIEKEPHLKEELADFLQRFTTDIHNQRLMEYSKYKYLCNPQMIMAIIDRISFSRQKKLGTSDWYKTLGIHGCFVRNIVSDADKLEAIGKAGIDRCRDYTIEKLTHEGKEITTEIIYNDVETHYHEKLKLIASMTYMKTIPGWCCAQILAIEMLFERMKLKIFASY